MRLINRMRLAVVALLVVVVAAALVTTGAVAHKSHGGPAPRHFVHHPFHGGQLPPVPDVQRLDLSGLVVDAAYSKGRNTGNTFRQTYGAGTVQGVPTAGPYVGQTFPPANYVALAIGNGKVYVTWQDPTYALIDVFVMDFKKHLIYDYAPGGPQPESIGRLTVVNPGPTHFH